MGELEELRKAGIDPTLRNLVKFGIFDFDCREYCPLEKCVYETVSQEKIEKLEELTGKTVVLWCPIYLSDPED